MISFDELPSDMLWEIATWLDPDSYLQMQATCKRFNKVLGTEYHRIEYHRLKTHTTLAPDGCWTSTTFWKYDLRTCIIARGYDKVGDRFWYFKNKRHRDGDKPAIELADGDKHWYHNGNRHRDDDKPAIEYANGDKKWYRNENLHRDGNKPAVERADGRKQWWVDGVRIR